MCVGGGGAALQNSCVWHSFDCQDGFKLAGFSVGFDRGLAPYDLGRYGQWVGLSGHISATVLQQLLPVSEVSGQDECVCVLMCVCGGGAALQNSCVWHSFDCQDGFKLVGFSVGFDRGLVPYDLGRYG
jgi:hypothetical protein